MDEKTVIDFNDDYTLDVSLAFRRQIGEVTVSHEMEITEAGDEIATILPVMRDFLRTLGFEWVDQLAVVNTKGDVTFITE